ncbi:class-III aminotransferase, partial [Helicosporidium sp. ATCC 50920]
RPATLVRATAAAQRKGAVDAIGQQTIADEKKYLVQTYARPDMVIESGEGSTVTDTSGRTYLDFYSGIAVNALGHGHPAWLSAVNRQASVLCHTSNAFHTRPQVELAKKLVSSSFADRVFFANTGTEANEAAIKFARKFAKVHAGLDPYDASSAQKAPCEIVSFTGSFHGRTMGSLALTYKDRYRTPFAPLMPHARMLPYGDVAAARAAVKKGVTAAVVVEPVQGEGGIYPAPPGFLEALRQLCDEAGALLVFDEVQVGLGRTGTLWAHEQFGVEPDMMSLAKPLAGGLPIGVLLVKERVAEVMDVGDHGSTFAGNPFVCAAANAVLDVIAEPAFLREVRRKGDLLVDELRGALGGNSHVREVRGRGLIVGVQLDAPAAGVVA